MPQQLVMTPQLQLAIRMLTMSREEIHRLLEAEAARLGVLERLADDQEDPLDAAERAEAAEDRREPWLLSRSAVQAAPGQPEADVVVAGSPPIATANGGFPRYGVTAGENDELMREAAWLVRAVRQRARTFERIANAVVAENHAFFTGASDAPRQLARKVVAEAVGMHHSTIERVAGVGLIQSARGLTRFDELIRVTRKRA